MKTLILMAILILSACVPKEVRDWNDAHAIPCDADNCGKTASR